MTWNAKLQSRITLVLIVAANTMFAIPQAFGSDVTALEQRLKRMAAEILSPAVLPTSERGGPVVAVLPFLDLGNQQSSFGQWLTDRFSASCQRRGLRLVERTRLQDSWDEIGLSTGEYTSDESAKSYGALLGADLLVRGTWTNHRDHIQLDVAAVEVESGLKKTGSMEIVKSQLIADLIGEAPAVTRTEVMVRSAFVPGWGQLYSRRARGWAYLSGSLAAAAGGVTFAVLGANAGASEERAIHLGDTEAASYWNDRRRLHEGALLVSLGILIVVYAVNIIDAAVLDTDPLGWRAEGRAGTDVLGLAF